MTGNAKDLVRKAVSRPALQPLWSRLLKLCHAGMNYGGGQSVSNSGELEALAFGLRSLGDPPSIVLFDVGANNGEYCDAALSLLGPGARVLSFEPQASSFNLLSARFQNDPRVTLRKLALGREPGEVDLFYSADSESTASLHGLKSSGHGRSETVEISTVDQVCREEGIDHLHVLKIDTEGHEMEVLAGAREMLAAGTHLHHTVRVRRDLSWNRPLLL